MKRKPNNPITKIRTGNGDGGLTYFRGSNIPKSDPLVEFIGNIDESCAFLGKLNHEKYTVNIIKNSIIILFEIGAMTHSPDALEKNKYRLNEYVIRVESYMKEYIANNQLVELNGFIIPDNWNADAMIARTIIRKTERSAVVAKLTWAVPALNIMSDFLFLYAWIRSDHSRQWIGFTEETEN